MQRPQRSRDVPDDLQRLGADDVVVDALLEDPLVGQIANNRRFGVRGVSVQHVDVPARGAEPVRVLATADLEDAAADAALGVATRAGEALEERFDVPAVDGRTAVKSVIVAHRREPRLQPPDEGRQLESPGPGRPPGLHATDERAPERHPQEATPMAPRDELCHQVSVPCWRRISIGRDEHVDPRLGDGPHLGLWQKAGSSSPTVSIACARQRQSDPPGWPS